MNSEQLVTSIVAEGKDIRVTYGCTHSGLWTPLPGYSAEGYAAKLQPLVGTRRECPTCGAEAFVQQQEGAKE